METETYEDAITILRSEANKLLSEGDKGKQLMVDTLVVVAGFLDKRREEIKAEKEAATLPDENNK